MVNMGVGGDHRFERQAIGVQVAGDALAEAAVITQAVVAAATVHDPHPIVREPDDHRFAGPDVEHPHREMFGVERRTAGMGRGGFIDASPPHLVVGTWQRHSVSLLNLHANG